MSKVSLGFYNFTRGVLSPLVRGRVDYDGYFNGATVLENFLVKVQGPITKRPGFYYIATAGVTTSPVRMIPFIFSKDQAYALEFGEKYMRVYRDLGQVWSGGSPYEITTPWAGASLYQIQFTQSADTIYIVHPETMPQKLVRYGHTNWHLSGVSPDLAPVQPIMNNAGVSLVWTPSATYSYVGDTGCVRTGIDPTSGGTTVFYACDVGLTWRINQASGTSDSFKIIALDPYRPGTSAYVQVAHSNGTWISGVPFTSYGKPSWSSRAGYPSCVKFHDNRLYYAGTSLEPATLWGSYVGDYDNFMNRTEVDAVTDADGVTFQLQNANIIQWIESVRTLLVGTMSGVIKISGGNDDDPITYESTAKTHSRRGCEALMPEIVGESIMYVQKGGRKVRELAYSLERDGYVAPDRTIIAEHLLKSGVSCMAYQQEPDSILWCGIKDGTLAAFTYEPDEKVFGWSQHNTQGVIESVCLIPGPTGDQLWASVIRSVAGVSTRFVECMNPQYF